MSAAFRWRSIVRVILPAVALLVAAGVLPAGAVTITPVTSVGGMTAWLVEDHTLPVVSVDLAFRGGASLDPSGKAGLATLTMDLLDEGAGDLDSSTYQGKLEDLGTSIGFSAAHDTVDINLRATTANLDASMDLLHLALTAPRFDSEAVARVRSQLVAAMPSKGIPMPKPCAARPTPSAGSASATFATSCMTASPRMS
jgi:zinc protease